MSIKKLVLDFAGVCYPFDHSRVAEAWSEYSDMPAEEIRKIVFGGGMGGVNGGIEEAFNQNKFPPEVFRQKVRGAARLAGISDEDFDAGLHLQFLVDEFNEPLDRLLGRVRAQNPDLLIVLASNTNQTMWKGHCSTFPFVHRNFADNLRVLSFEVNSTKPDTPMFDLARTIGAECAFSEILFVDDNENNAKAAQRLGIHGAYYVHPRDDISRLVEAFKKNGIVVS